MRNSQIRRGYRPGSRTLSCMGQLRTVTRSLIGRRVILGGRKCHSVGWDVLRRNHWNLFFEENGAKATINSELYIGVTGEVLHRAPGPLSKLYAAPLVPARWCYPTQLTSPRNGSWHTSRRGSCLTSSPSSGLPIGPFPRPEPARFFSCGVIRRTGSTRRNPGAL